MERRNLNFSAPLLSVRRITASPVSTSSDSGRVTPRLANGRHTLPLPKSDFSLQQVTKPVAVPFHWEDIPGRSKDEEPKIQSREEPSVTPRLPPGKLVEVKKKPLGKEEADQKAMRPSLKSFSSNETATEAKCSKEGGNERRASKFEDENDVYSDAHETLSPPTESFSMNCSAAGTCQSHSANVKPSIDPQTRDFMMKRFLPAAKAMALETPHISIKKQQHTVPHEQPRKVTRVIRQDTSPLPNQQRSHMELVQYGQYKEEEESEAEEDEYDDPGYIAPKGCGLFPRLGLRNSLCPLPVPAMKARARALISCSSNAAIPGKTTHSRSHSQPLKQGMKITNSQSHSQPLNKAIKPANNQSHSQPLNKVIKPANSQSNGQPLNKRDQDAAYYLKADRRCFSGELPRLVNNQAAHSNLFRLSGEQPKGRASPFRQSRSPCISPYRNERPKSPFTGGGFLGVPKEENVKVSSSKFNMNDKVGPKSQEVLSHQRNKQGSYTVIPMIEKTLYVDTVNTTKKSCLNSSSLYTKERVDSAVEDIRTLLKRSGMEQMSTDESLFQDIKCLTNFESNGVSEPAVLESVEDSSSSFSDISHIKGQVVAVEDSQLGVDTRSDDIIKEDPGNASIIVIQSPLPPPLPKSPSQSWLSSTLSSTPSSKPVSTGTKRHSKRSSSKPSSAGTKWETIVKTSNLHHDHVRFSEELITHVCQQPKN
ncbi:uncharacterized protein LOC126786134 [Argentina anserina]|uniref:uncharacterized protein LOC126786134 n=1 Tax=Argentina anserina TaxID=57926 RepID=UPI0021765C65|nr:uncharacterized protein LOC126786134 [Potentilla anserina]XP_050367821.1 uncharacterized protein LOC126786134 [Potentilla anserina]